MTAFFPIEDPGFIVWNPVRPLMEIEEYEWMQKELERIWPPRVPKRKMSSSYFWSDPLSGRNCLVQISADGTRYGIAYDLPANPYESDFPLPSLRMRRRVARFYWRHRGMSHSNIGLESLRAYIVACSEAIVGLS